MFTRFKLKVFLSLVVSVIFFISFATSNKYFYSMAKGRNLSRDLLDIKNAESVLPNKSFIYIDKSSLNPANAFANTRWFPYVLKNQRFVFDESYSTGGYIYDVMTLNDVSDDADIYSLVYTGHEGSENGENVLYRNKSYSIIKFDNLHKLKVNGLYDEEQWGRWMADEFTVQSKSACEITITILGKFSGISSDASLIVKSMAGEVQYPINDNKINISVKTANKQDKLIIKSSVAPVAPSEISSSLDTRRLSFMIGEVYASNCSLAQ